jgi:hypothetical protein
MALMSINYVGKIELGDLGSTVLRALRGLRFGSVEIVVHDGRAVQIERRERIRLEPAGDRQPDRWGRTHDSNHRAHRSTGGSVPAPAGETIE